MYALSYFLQVVEISFKKYRKKEVVFPGTLQDARRFHLAYYLYTFSQINICLTPFAIWTLAEFNLTEAKGSATLQQKHEQCFGVV